MNFQCSKCNERVMKLRRCKEDREFSAKDNPSLWPMYIGDPRSSRGFPFCPGKASWDSNAVSTFNTLVISAETGNLYEAGGIADQPSWFVSLLRWFLPRYNDLKFASRARSILGDDNARKKPASQKPSRRK